MGDVTGWRTEVLDFSFFVVDFFFLRTERLFCGRLNFVLNVTLIDGGYFGCSGGEQMK